MNREKSKINRGFAFSLGLHALVIFLLLFDYIKLHRSGGTGKSELFEGRKTIEGVGGDDSGGGGGGQGLKRKKTFGSSNRSGNFQPEVISENVYQVEIEYVTSEEVSQNYISEKQELNNNSDHSNSENSAEVNPEKIELNKNTRLENELKAIELIKQKIKQSEMALEQERIAALKKIENQFAEERRKEIKEYQRQIQRKLDMKLNEKAKAVAGGSNLETAIENGGVGAGEGVGEGIGSGTGKYTESGDGNGSGFGSGGGDGILGGGGGPSSECVRDEGPLKKVITVMIYNPRIDRALVCSGHDEDGRCILKFKKQKQITTAGTNQFMLYYPQFPAVLDFAEQGVPSNIITIVGKNVKVRGLSKDQYKIFSPDILNSEYPGSLSYKIPGDEREKNLSSLKKMINNPHMSNKSEGMFQNTNLDLISSETAANELARVWTFARQRINYLRCFSWGGGAYTPKPNSENKATSFLSGT